MSSAATPFQIKWAVKSAGELAQAQSWMKENLAGVWKAELLGVKSEAGDDEARESRVEIRYSFESQADCLAFVGRFLDAQIEAASPLSAIAPVADGGTPGAPLNEAQFESSARQILTTSEPVSAGRLQLLGLGRVQAHFGDDWERVRPRLEDTVQRAIVKRLGPRDVFRATGDLNFTILFADLSADEAYFKCRMMVEEITRMLIGDDVPDMFSVETVAVGVDTKSVLAQGAEPGRLAAEIEGLVEQEQKRQIAAARAEFEIREEFDPLADLRLSFRPIWDVRRSVVASFQCLAMRNRSGGAAPFDVSALPNCDEAMLQKYDALVLDKTIDDLAIMHQNGRRLILCLPMHFESVLSPSRRRAYLEPWERVPAAYQKLTIFEVVGWPHGVPQGRVAEIVSALKPFSAGVFARLPIGVPTARNFANTGLIAVGADLAASPENEEFLVKALQRFVQNAETAHVLSYVHGLSTFSLTLAAITSGFNLINGGAISTIAERPESGYRFNLDDLYSRVLPKSSE